MDEIDLKLTKDEVNFVLNLLQQRPYQEVAPLIKKIVEQGEAQLNVTQQGSDESQAP